MVEQQIEVLGLWVPQGNSMTSIKRKIRRKKEKDTEKKMSEQLTMFDKIGDHCLACNEPFDKTDKEQVKTWTVVVRTTEKKVNLYCPACWNKAHDIIEDFKKQRGEGNV